MRKLEHDLLALLCTLGIRLDGHGYMYAKDYVLIQIGPRAEASAQKVFMLIAERRRTSVIAVKSSLRFSIANANRFGLKDKLKDLFGFEVAKEIPTVKETLNLIVEYLRIYKGYNAGEENVETGI